VNGVSLPQAVQELIEEYHTFQAGLPLRQAEAGLQDLVRFNGNKGMPVHGWFAYKEGFSADLLHWLCQAIPCRLADLEYILDPFCGVGTSLLSAQLGYRGNHILHIYGIEYNPFVRFVAQAKLSWPDYRLDRIAKLTPRILAPRLSEPHAVYEVPGLSTIQNPEVFPSTVLQELLDYRNRLRAELDGDPEEKFFLLGWASAIERVSGVRRDGRALRFKEKNSSIPTVYDALKDQWELMLNDLRELSEDEIQPLRVEYQILAGDGRTLQVPELEGKAFDLIIYSPPYLNNIDYSEVYKMELWLSGHIVSREEFRALRLGTLRSHPSIRFPETNLVDDLSEDSWARRLRTALVEALPDDEDRIWRIRLIRGYMDDMYQALSAQFRVARPNAPVVCVVGNSLHGRKEHPIPIATDLLITSLAQAVGFDIQRLQIARQLRRRDSTNGLLRETIIILRRP
jgi:DNA modification methylase